MNAQPREEQSLLVRVDRLERENVRLKRIGAVVLLILSVVLLTGQAKQSAPAWQRQVLRVGKVQASTIEVLPEEVLAAKGFSHVPALRISPYELSMFDPDGKARVYLNSISGQLQMGEQLETDNTGNVSFLNSRSTVTLDSRGIGGSLRLSDMNGKETVDLYANGPVLNLTSDHPRLFLGRNDSYSTVIGSTSLVTRATGKTHDTTAASVVLFDPKDNVIWSAPDASVDALAALNYSDSQITQLRNTLDDLKRQLGDFKDAACPILKTARVDELTSMRLHSACL